MVEKNNDSYKTFCKKTEKEIIVHKMAVHPEIMRRHKYIDSNNMREEKL